MLTNDGQLSTAGLFLLLLFSCWCNNTHGPNRPWASEESDRLSCELQRKLSRPRTRCPCASMGQRDSKRAFASSPSTFGCGSKNQGTPKWVTLESANMGTKTCGLPLLFNFEPHPFFAVLGRFYEFIASLVLPIVSE